MSLTPLPHRARYGLHWSDDGRCIFTLGQGLGVLNLTCPTFALCSHEYRPLWNAHVPSDLAQSNAGCVGGSDLLPNRLRKFCCAPFASLMIVGRFRAGSCSTEHLYCSIGQKAKKSLVYSRYGRDDKTAAEGLRVF